MDKLYNLFLVSNIVETFGYYTEFKLYEESIKYEENIENIENISHLINIISVDNISISNIIKTKDEKTNDLIDSYTKLNDSIKMLKEKYNLDKDTITKIFETLEKETILSNTAYYLSIPICCNNLILYIIGDITKEDLLKKFVLLSLNGKHKLMDKRIFYKTYTKVLDIYNTHDLIEN